MFTLNINESCEFVLTERGAKVWNSQYSGMPVEWKIEHACAGEKIVSQLWCVMQVFGPHTQMGMMGPFFEGNDLVFPDIEAAPK